MDEHWQSRRAGDAEHARRIERLAGHGLIINVYSRPPVTRLFQAGQGTLDGASGGKARFSLDSLVRQRSGEEHASGNAEKAAGRSQKQADDQEHAHHAPAGGADTAEQPDVADASAHQGDKDGENAKSAGAVVQEKDQLHQVVLVFHAFGDSTPPFLPGVGDDVWFSAHFRRQGGMRRPDNQGFQLVRPDGILEPGDKHFRPAGRVRIVVVEIKTAGFGDGDVHPVIVFLQDAASEKRDDAEFS